MSDNLSIRAYTPAICSHEHDFHQIVLPLHGVIEISVNGRDGVIGVGQIVIIQKGIEHRFKAQKQSRFLVIDINDLPANASSLNTPFASISESMRSYCNFVEIQLQHQIDTELKGSMFTLFRDLLAQQDFVPAINDRITRVLAYIDSNLAKACALEELAAQANLSKSHFKTEFKHQTGQSSGKYLVMRRMEKARALLANTDLPVQIVAERVGYTSQSAFTRRFSAYFGEPPNRFMSR